MKEELVIILESRQEKLSDYMENNGYESDFENDYSSGELIEYLISCGLTSARMRQQAFMYSFHKYIAIKLLQLEKKTGDTGDNNLSINPKAWRSLFQQAYKFTEESIAVPVSQDEAFAHALKNNFNEAFVPIMQRLGEEIPVTTEEFIKLLQAIPGFSDCVGDYYAAISPMPFVMPAFDRIPRLVLQTIISSIPAPTAGQIIQIKHLNEVKKRIHRLQVAIQQITVQQSKLVEMQLD